MPKNDHVINNVTNAVSRNSFQILYAKVFPTGRLSVGGDHAMHSSRWLMASCEVECCLSHLLM